MADKMPWWRRGVIYQLLVPSYYDTTGDGMGDLPGVTGKLDYLQWLGVDAVWLSPIFGSPFLDFGYDVSDFRSINPAFGTLDDFDRLIEEAHRRDIRIILDWIPNHTSSEHPWFAESRSSRDNPKRSWYVWADPKPDGSPPSNWLSIFGGSAWALDEATGQYYLHTFLPEQPDLNWRNPDVRQALHETLRFWLGRGVDGFRIDALDLLVEEEGFPDNPPNPNYNPERDGPDMVVVQQHTRDHPEVHRIVSELRSVVDEFPDRVLLGELYLGVDQLVAYYGVDRPEIHLPLNMLFPSAAWNADELYGSISDYLSKVPENEWPCWLVSSHDGKRVATRAGADQAPVAAMLLLTLRGTPIVYYGDEIGMEDVDVPDEKAVDPQGKLIGRKRDPVRTPMQWDDQIYAGFSSSEPWLPVADNYESVSVNAQSATRSLIELYRRLLALRKEEPAFAAGALTSFAGREGVLSYRRELDGARFLVLLNTQAEARTFNLADFAEDNQGAGRAEIVVSTFLDRLDEVHDTVEVRANEGLILKER